MRSLLVAAAAVLLALTVTPAAHAAPPAPSHDWTPVDVGTDQGLRGLAAVDRRTAWVGGSDGGVWRTTDGGATWADVSPPDSAGLLFRDVEATDARHAHVLAIGEAEASRIYRTTDGGATWELTFVNDEPAAFYDCFAFWPGGRHGIAMSDPVDGRFRILVTRDSGATWQVVDPAGMPAAKEGEFGFAASGTCLVTAGARDVWLASGGTAARIFHSGDRGRTWTVAESTLPASAAGGVFSLAFANPRKGIAVGGDFEAEDNGVDYSATTDDRGRTWTNAGDLGGYRSGVTWLAGARAAIAVGPSGSDITRDGGRTWTTFSDTGYDAVQATRDGAVWASGSAGRVGRLGR
jgi:photosystem II stability/assembly factor-like uncharacterized protein